MNFFDGVRAAQAPLPLKIALGLGVFGLAVLNGYVIFVGLIDRTRDFWVAAGTSMLAAALPFVAIGLALAFVNVGVQTLQRRTDRVLEKLFPTLLAQTFEPDDPPWRDGGRAPTQRRLATVSVARYRDECWANYRITDGSRCVTLRAEINVKTMNLDIVFDHAALVARKIDPAAVSSMFPHALGGAEQAGYAINKEVLAREGGEGHRCALVLNRALDPRFLWDAEDQLYIAQDLLLMIRAMTTEQPALFVSSDARNG